MKQLGKLLLRPYITASLLFLSGGGLWYYARWAFIFIRERSDSLSTDFNLKLGYYVLLAVTSLMAALLYDVLASGGRWIRQSFGISNEKLPDYLGNIRLIRSGAVQFYSAWLVSLVALWWITDSVNGDFHSYYSRYGKYVTMLRSGDESARREALGRLMGVREKWIRAKIIDAIRNGPASEALYTSWAAAEKEVSDPMILEAIRDRARREHGTVQVHLLLDLARLGDRTVFLYETATGLLRSQLALGKKPDPLVVLVLAFLGSPRALPLLAEVVHRYPDSDGGQVALFALAKFGGMTPRERAKVREVIKWAFKKGPYRLRCVAAVAAAVVGLDGELQRQLMWEFESSQAAKVRCKPETFSLHPSGKGHTINITNLHIGGFSYLAAAPERYRERLLRTLALYKDDNVDRWLHEMAENPHLDDYILELVRQAARRKVRKMVPARW